MLKSSTTKTTKCLNCEKDFQIKSNIPGKLHYCKECVKKNIDLVCEECGKNFTGKMNRRIRRIVCDDCLHAYSTDIEFSDLSSRTISKVLKRAATACKICGWNECSLDIHHIVPISKGGFNNLENLIALCPCCHRKSHNGFFTIEYLQERSMKDLDWKKYYRKQKNNKTLNIEEILEDYTKMPLRELSIKHKIGYKLINKICNNIKSEPIRKRKFEATKEELEELIKNKPMTEVGRIFGVTDNAIKKRCRKLGIELKPMRGYWVKVRASAKI